MAEITENTFQQLFENIPGLYLVLAPETYAIVAASDAYLSATMTKREEILGKTLFEVFPSWTDGSHEEGTQKVQATLEKVKSERQAEAMPVTYYPIPKPESKGGGFEDRWWSPFYSPVFNESGDIEYIIHRVEDVTPIIQQLKQEKDENLLQQLNDNDSYLAADIILRGQDLQKAKEQAFERLKENEKRLQEVLENLPAAVIIAEPDGNLIYSNPEVERILGASFIPSPDIESYGNWPLYKPEKDEFYPVDEMPMARTLRTGEVVKEEEMRILRPDGTWRYASVNTAPIYDADGSLKFAVSAHIDITELKKTEQALLSYQEQLRSLTAKLSKAEEKERHRLGAELHNNLGQMLTLCKIKINALEKRESSESGEINELKELVDDAIKYARELMFNLKPPPTFDKENIHEVLDWVVDNMSKHGLHVTIEDDGQPKPLSEEIQTTLYQCVRELLFNVLKHAETDKAFISLSLANDLIRIAVEDKGTGFDMNEAEAVHSGQNGFGLFHIQERISFLGGNFEIRSEPGKGTIATIYAPLKRNGKSDLLRHSKVEPQTLSKQTDQVEEIRVLLVDDHDMVRRGLREMIEAQDDLDIVGEASGGKEAILLAAKTSPDVIVMDVNMPDVNGIEATSTIKSETPNVCIVGLSFHDSEEVAKDMRRAGADAYLTKSEAFESLCATIRSEGKVQKKSSRN